MTAYGIYLHGLANGQPSEYDHTWVVHYDPNYMRGPGNYDGGLLETTANKAKAGRFSFADAVLLWKSTAPAPFDVRPDGKLNRPLTAFTVSIGPLEDLSRCG